VRRYVLDASVAAKWFLSAADETLTEEALHLLHLYLEAEVQFFVPDLFFAELANIFWKAERLGRCDSQTTDAALTELIERNLPTFPSAPRLKQAAGIARTFGRTVYDSLYLALAQELNATFVSADARLVNSVRGRLPAAWLGAL